MRSVRTMFALVFVCGALSAPACGQDGQGFVAPDGGSSEGGSNDGNAMSEGFGGACTNGQPCGDGGVCTGGVCCTPELVCGSACCSGSQVCAFQQCVAPGAICIDSSDCGPNEYCDYSLGNNDGGTTDASSDGACIGGASTQTGRCLPKPPICADDAGVPDGGALTCLEKCEYHPTGTFSPVLNYAWGGHITPPFDTDVMMTPIVLNLDDDNCDGKVDAKDIPEILFTSFTQGDYQHNGTLHAITIENGVLSEKWSVPGALNPAYLIAGSDLDGVLGNEVVGCGADGAVHAYHADGSPFWASSPMTCMMPSIADVDGDGKPEVIVEGGILNGATGTTKASYSVALIGSPAVSDIDGDGKLDVVSASQGFHADGTLFVDTGVPGTWNAIGDFDMDGKPEVVAVDYLNHTVSFWHYDASKPGKFAFLRQGVDINGSLVQHCPAGSAGATQGGGPPTVADFNGDGTPDVALAGGIGYAVLDGKKVINGAVANPQTLLWTAPTTDCSSAATGSSVFDFNGDGIAEVIYSDEEYLRIYEGPTGKVIWQTCNTTGTLEEYPVIADVDNDGHADIVVVSNAYASSIAEYQCNDGTNIAQAGVRVFGDKNGSWVRTRRVWNERAYHVTNIGEDGIVPANELPNWTQPGLNNFRQNKQPGSEFAAPDAVVSVAPACAGPYGLLATVRNIGEAALPAGVIVGFYAGTPPAGMKLGSQATMKALYAAESETLFLPLPNPPAGVKDGSVLIYAVVDDSMVPHPSWHECRTDNNTSATVSAKCKGNN